MKNQASGVLIAPEPTGVHVSENLKALTNQVSNLKKLSAKVCGFKKNHHLCNAFHLIQATMFANFSRWHFLCLLASYIVPTPVWSVNAPTACIRWKATGKRNFFLFPSRNSQHIVSF